MVKIVSYVSYVFYHNKKMQFSFPDMERWLAKPECCCKDIDFHWKDPSSLLFPFGSSNLKVCHFRIKRLLSIQMSLFEVLSAYKKQTGFPASKGTWTFYRH